MSSTRKDIPPPDLELRVRIASDSRRAQLMYELSSPTSVAPFAHQEVAGPQFQGTPEDLLRRLLRQIEEWGDGLDVDGGLVLRPEIQRKLEGLGQELWRQLFGGEMQLAYRQFRHSVRSLLILSDEPWIPWEMIKPYDDRGDLIDDDFFAERFELTRWLPGTRPLASEIQLDAFACLVPNSGLPLIHAERELISRLFRSQGGLRDASPAAPSVDSLTAMLQKGGIGLLHFAGHGMFDPSLPNEAGFPLADGSVFRPSDLHGSLQTQLSKDRPLVFLNACRSGQQAWSWTSLGGWADRWVRACGCGAFLGPQWNVKDSAAFAFAQVFYEALVRGETLGSAAKAARQAARKTAPADPSWLAYAVYGHPNARLLPKQAAPAELPEVAGRLRRSKFFDDIFARDSVADATYPKPAPQAERTSVAPSSNLQIKRQFTDRDRDLFVEESFEQMAGFFESSLASLQEHNSRVAATFRRVDRNHFTASIYRAGKKESSCRIWLSRGHMGDIAYANGDSGDDNTYNEILWVEDDGYSLYFRPSGLRIFNSSEKKVLNRQAAEEYLWSILIERLQ